MFLVTSSERVEECAVRKRSLKSIIISCISFVYCSFSTEFQKPTTLQNVMNKILKKLSPKIGDKLVTTFETYPTFGNVVYGFVTRICDEF